MLIQLRHHGACSFVTKTLEIFPTTSEEFSTPADSVTLLQVFRMTEVQGGPK